jgi:type IV pilus assembly protein PilP
MRKDKSLLLCRPIVRLSIVSTVFLTLLAGCSNSDFSDLNQYISEIKQRPKGTIKALPEIKVINPFVFKPEDVRDPFKPLKPISDPVNGGPDNPPDGRHPDFTRRKEELEAFPIETLKMIGTIQMKSELWGLIKATDNTVYRVKIGNYMGQNYGKIIRVSVDKIELMEWVPDKRPETWREQQMSVTLTDELGGK